MMINSYAPEYSKSKSNYNIDLPDGRIRITIYLYCFSFLQTISYAAIGSPTIPKF